MNCPETWQVSNSLFFEEEFCGYNAWGAAANAFFTVALARLRGRLAPIRPEWLPKLSDHTEERSPIS